MHPTFAALAAGAGQPFKRAQLGLFHGAMKQYGNNVPFSKKKTARTWLPNVHNKRLWSEGLQEFVRVKITARALRTVDKFGGLDRYLLGTKAELLGYEGMKLRLRLREKHEENKGENETWPSYPLGPVDAQLPRASPAKSAATVPQQIEANVAPAP